MNVGNGVAKILQAEAKKGKSVGLIPVAEATWGSQGLGFSGACRVVQQNGTCRGCAVRPRLRPGYR